MICPIENPLLTAREVKVLSGSPALGKFVVSLWGSLNFPSSSFLSYGKETTCFPGNKKNEGHGDNTPDGQGVLIGCLVSVTNCGTKVT